MQAQQHVGIGIKEFLERRRHYLAAAHAGKRYVIERHGMPLAALVSLADLKRLNASQGESTAHITLTHLRAEITRLLDQASRGSRYQVTADYSDRTYSAALIGLGDLNLLESGNAGNGSLLDEVSERDEKFRRALQEAGVEVSWPTGEPVPDSERVLIQLAPGEQLLSEQIIAERR